MIVDREYFKQKFCGYGKKEFPINFSEEVSIRSCARCNGIGTISREELSNYHKREYETIVEDCPICNNQGRVFETTISASFGDIPYNALKKPSNFSRIPVETIYEPYDSERASKLKGHYKSFFFNVDDIAREHPV